MSSSPHHNKYNIDDNTVYAVVQQPDQNRWLEFKQPERILSSHNLDDVCDIVQQIERACKQENIYAVGFIGYEAASAFDSALPSKYDNNQFKNKNNNELPLIWFALFREFNVIDKKSLSNTAYTPPLDLNWQPDIDEARYRDDIASIKHYIHEGDTYQVNYSYRLKTKFNNTPWELFIRMINAQDLVYHAGYCAYIETSDFAICSASPELFIHYDRKKQALVSIPMKGTAARGYHIEQDQRIANSLQASVKNRAENIMITDMVRNDSGKIAATGSVSVSDLLKLNQYPTFWTMTSQVNAKCPDNLLQILKSLFPAASITGAPKQRAMQIINELEDTPREIYTGSIGMVSADNIQLNVAIRTVLINKHQQQATFGVGGGIVWDSQSEDEFAECHTKANVLTYHTPAFKLISTLRWQQGEYIYLDKHIKRIMASAHYFGWDEMNPDKIINALKGHAKDHAKEFNSNAMRVRIAVSRHDDIEVTSSVLTPLASPYRLAIASTTVNSRDFFLHHKTSRRDAYEQAQHDTQQNLSLATKYDDIVLVNEHGNITETCIANIFIRYDNQWYTPDLDSGLLNGIGRQVFLEKHPETIIAPISVDMLKKADEIHLTNAVRDVWQAILIDA